jgi:hypothetical protein
MTDGTFVKPQGLDNDYALNVANPKIRLAVL